MGRQLSALILTFLVAASLQQDLENSQESCDYADEFLKKVTPSFDEHKEIVDSHLRRIFARSTKPSLMSRMDPDVHKYTSVFLQMKDSPLPPAVPAQPGIFGDAGAHLGQIADLSDRTMGKWNYGYCVCEVCHNIMEQLQVKMFSEYGYDFNDDDIHDVLEDSFCENVLPYYKSPCQYILSYRYHSLASMIMYMIPYDICQTQRMCLTSHPS